MSAPPPTDHFTASPPSIPSSHPPPSRSHSRSHPSHSSQKTPPPPRPQSSSSSSVPTAAVVCIALGAVAMLVLVSICCLCCRKKRRRNRREFEDCYSGDVPLPIWKDESYGKLHHKTSWQINEPPIGDHLVKISPQPRLPPPNASRPPLLPPKVLTPPPAPPQQVFSSSDGSGSMYTDSECQLPPPPHSRGIWFSKSTFTFEELVMATNRFSDANLLGQGGFGYVHKGMLPNGKEVAVKQLKIGSGQGEREFQAEIETISRVHHKHLVSLVGYCISGDQRLLVYEYVANSTLEFHLHGQGRPTMGWSTRIKIALGSAKGLSYLHEDCHPKIIHRDIKSANILLDYNFEAKVTDFGLAKFAADNNTHVSTRVMGTFGYLAPEYASSGKLTDKSDVFSFGIMLLELITGRRPVDLTQTDMDDSLIDWARPLLIRSLEDGKYDIIVDPKLKRAYNHNEMTRMIACASSCIRHSARSRPKMSQIVRALEGNMSLEDLNEGHEPDHYMLYSSYLSSDYNSTLHSEDKKVAVASRDYSSSEYSAYSIDAHKETRQVDGKTREKLSWTDVLNIRNVK